MDQPENDAQIRGRFAARLFLASAVGRAAQIVDGLMLWGSAGGGAFIGLLIVQADDVKTVLPADIIVEAAWLYLGAVAVAVIARYLSAFLAAASSAVETVMKIGERLGEFDPTSFQAEVLKAYPRPFRWFIAAHQEMDRKDETASTRLLVRLGVLQGLLMLLHFVFLLRALGSVVSGLLAP